MRAVHAVFDGNAVFDQASSSREFVIAAADVWVRVVGPPLWQAIHRQAPGVRLDFRALDPAVFRDPLSAMRSVDFVICPHGLLPGMRGHGPAHPGQPGSAAPADHGAVVAPAVRHRPRPPVAAPRAGQALSAGLIPATGFC
ncbi:MAG TPA: hypothetical protein VHW06_06550 [Streptosporangiaceae bacterium]|nr:hypothetical protein [Streptosporangiaceae bacterium]